MTIIIAAADVCKEGRDQFDLKPRLKIFELAILKNCLIGRLSKIVYQCFYVNKHVNLVCLFRSTLRETH